MPVLSSEIELLLRNKESFNDVLHYMGCYKMFKILNDKKELSVLANELRIKTPATYNDISEAKVPCVIKPRNMTSAKGVKYIWTENSLKLAIKKYKRRDNIIIQEYVEGIGVGYSIYAVKGKILKAYGHKRLAEYPVSGGSSVYRDEYNDERMKAVTEKVFKIIPWTGFAMFEFKLLNNNELYLIEINPRIWGSINQGLQNGVNFFEPILGRVDLYQKKSDNVKTYLSPLLYLALIKYIFKGNFKPFITFIKNRKLNRADVSFIEDPLGYLSIILRRLL